jgi:hypothetical protein
MLGGIPYLEIKGYTKNRCNIYVFSQERRSLSFVADDGGQGCAVESKQISKGNRIVANH